MTSPPEGDSGSPFPPPEANLARIRTLPFADRASKVTLADLGGPPRHDGSFRDFLDSLPTLLAADSLRTIARTLAEAVRSGRGVLWMVGGHVVKTGLGPVFVRAMDQGTVGFLAGNGALAVHDWEMARWGRTSEDVEAGLAQGTFGMAEETAEELNEAVGAGADRGMGLGEAVGWALSERRDLVAGETSVLLQAYRKKIPVSIHSAIGCEVIHQHPSADGAAIGAASMKDFLRLAEWLPALHDGGAVVNVGSAVILPEVFLKALAIARNLHGGKPGDFLAADFDMVRHYRPWMNVALRPTRTGGGTAHAVTGHHEIMIPLLAWAVEEYAARFAEGDRDEGQTS